MANAGDLGQCKWCGASIIFDAKYDNWEDTATGDTACGEGEHAPQAD